MNLYAPTTLVAEQQLDYAFGDISNRQTAMRDLRQASYSVNNLNQYTSRTVPGFVNVLGTATNTATVSLWSQDNLALYTPTTRQGDYFRGEMLVNNNTGALWLTITNVAVLSNYTGADIVTNTIGKLYMPKTAETFSYDLDGNLTNDGRWSYTWDAENRITSFTRNSAAPVGSRVKLDCQYDAQWRRTQKIVSTWNGSAYVAESTNKFVYDGWNLIAILDSNSSLLASFQWGMDASGTMQGAGGVGGLISMTVHQGPEAGTYFYCYDGNHNVTTLVNATNGATEAVYEYDPFLGIIRGTGRLAFLNPFAGSTKFCDWETGMFYYGYRYYDPETGRWLSRDSLGEFGCRLLAEGRQAFVNTTAENFAERLNLLLREPGGANLYGFIGNDPLDNVDSLGLLKFEGCSANQEKELREQLTAYCGKLKNSLPGCCKNKTIPPRLQYKCDNPDFTIKCESSKTGLCGSPNTCAWSLPGGRTLHMCPDGLAKVGICDDGYGCTLIHEMTHMIGHGGEKWPQQVEKCLGCKHWNGQ